MSPPAAAKRREQVVLLGEHIVLEREQEEHEQLALLEQATPELCEPGAQSGHQQRPQAEPRRLTQVGWQAKARPLVSTPYLYYDVSTANRQLKI